MAPYVSQITLVSMKKLFKNIENGVIQHHNLQLHYYI